MIYEILTDFRVCEKRDKRQKNRDECKSLGSKEDIIQPILGLAANKKGDKSGGIGYFSLEEPAMASIIEDTKLTNNENNRAGSQPSTENPGTI